MRAPHTSSGNNSNTSQELRVRTGHTALKSLQGIRRNQKRAVQPEDRFLTTKSVEYTITEPESDLAGNPDQDSVFTVSQFIN